jgi:hypothetical protein
VLRLLVADAGVGIVQVYDSLVAGERPQAPRPSPLKPWVLHVGMPATSSAEMPMRVTRGRPLPWRQGGEALGQATVLCRFFPESGTPPRSSQAAASQEPGPEEASATLRSGARSRPQRRSSARATGSPAIDTL